VFILSALMTGVARAELVGWWKLDEQSGAIAHDSSGKGNDGALLGGPVWAAGQIDGALQLDGVDDYCGSTSPTRGPDGSASSILAPARRTTSISVPATGAIFCTRPSPPARERGRT
jgi:hypothetical protein